jgi:hypothetical protein
MPVCSSGVSQPIPGSPANLVYQAEALAGFLTSVGLEFLAPVVGVLGLVSVDLLTLCGGDPPTPQLITDTDMLALGSFGSIPAQIVAVQHALSQVNYRLWYHLCQCATGTLTPAQPVQTPPNVVVIGSGASSPCFTGNYSGLFQLQPVVPAHYTNARQACPPGNTAVYNNGADTYDVVLIPAGHYTQVNLTGTIFYQPAPNDAVNVQVGMWTSPTAFTQQHRFSNGSQFGLTEPFTLSVPIAANVIAVGIEPVSASPPNNPGITTSFQADWLCGGTGPATQTPCVTDPITMQLLQQILAMVTTIQRQGDPFGYNFGPAHSGLTGSGELTVAGLLGVRVIMDVIPPGLGSEEGDVTEYFDAGWFCWGSLDGFDARIRLTHSPQISMPDNAGAFTRLSYTLTPGVSVTITEIVRIP